MKRSLFLGLLAVLFSCAITARAQQDTSSYFPLGLWGIWIDSASAPYNPNLNVDWDQEVSNWTNIKGSYLVAWMPDYDEGTIMDNLESIGYKMDIARNPWNGGYYGKPDTSLRSWFIQHYLDSATTWHSRARDKINGIKQAFLNRSGFYSYFVAHENDFYASSQNPDTTWWPYIGYIIDQIAEINPGRKSLVVNGGMASTDTYPHGITLSQFAQRFPNLGIYQVDHYVFYSTDDTSFDDQQSELDGLIRCYDNCRAAFRNGSTEWHAVIQAQREYRNGSNVYFRRPTFNELRVQANLALSKGARGISAFVYGSAKLPPPTAGPTIYQGQSYILGNNTHSASDISYYDGLVDILRRPFNRQLDNDPAHIPGFDNLAAVYDELKPIGSVLRKLRVYDAFPNSGTIPSNSANVYSVSGDKIEIGTFKRVDQGSDSTNYFMLVNRVCNNSDGTVSSAQTLSVVIGNGKYFIQDQSTKEFNVGTFDSDNNRTTFSVTLGPGQGKMFLLKPTREGTISSNTTWRNAEVVTSTVTVNSGVTLTVEQGTTVKFQSSTSLTVNGALDAQASSGNPVTFDRVATSGDWLGLKYQSGSSGTLDNAVIQYAKKGVYVASSSPTIQNCTIQNFTEQGIYVTGGSPKIYGNSINGWSGCAQVGTGIYVDNSGLGSSTLEIASSNVIKGCHVGIDVTAPIYKLEHNTLGTSGTYSDAASNAYGINFTGVGTVTNNKVYGDNNSSTGISLQPNSGNKITTYNLLDHHYIGLIDNGFQDGSITLNSFTNDQISFDNSDGWMTTQQNNFWDSGVTTYNILNFTQSDPDMTNNYLESYTVSANEKIYDANQFLRWYPPAGSAFSAGPLWKLGGPPGLGLPGATTTSESNIATFALSSYPNPFNPATTITFEVPQPTFVFLILYDMLGRQVKTLSESYRVKGTYSIVWDATDSRGALLSSGVYLLRMRAGNTVLTHKLLLTK